MNNGYELYSAVKAGKVAKIKELINDGADVNYVFKPEEYGYTSLHMAAYYAMNETIELLVNNGASINCCSLTGKTPLDFAIERHNRKETVSLLKSYGAEKGTLRNSREEGEVAVQKNVLKKRGR